MPDTPFPPERKKRSYMMDVDPSDIAAMPDLSGLARIVGDAAPMDTVPEDAWERWDGASHEPRVGVLLSYLLIPQPDPEAAPNWRTPCNEEHAIVAHLPSREDGAPAIVCPIVTWEEHSRRRPDLETPEALDRVRAGGTPGILPLFLPQDSHNMSAWVLARLAYPRAVTYRHLVRHCRGEQSGLGLTADYAEKLEATFAQQMASRRIPQARR